MTRALAVAIAILAIGVGGWFFFLRNPEQQHAFQARTVATCVLAEYLASKFPAHHALLISNPFLQTGRVNSDIVAMENAGVAGVKKGLAARATLEAVVYPEIKSEAEANPRNVSIRGDTTTPLSFLVAEGSFDKLATNHPQCEVLISLIGLPADLDDLHCWEAPKPAFALLLPDLRIIGDTAAVVRAVKSGKLAAFVLHKPGAVDSRAAVSGDIKGEFEKRFLLVTSENIDEMVRTYPQLFPAQRVINRD